MEACEGLHPSITCKVSKVTQSEPGATKRLTRSVYWIHQDFTLRALYSVREGAVDSGVLLWTMMVQNAVAHRGSTFPGKLFCELVEPQLSPEVLDATLLAWEQADVIRAKTREFYDKDAEWLELSEDPAHL